METTLLTRGVRKGGLFGPPHFRLDRCYAVVWVILALCMGAAEAAGQVGTVAGVVVDAAGQPLSNAQVMVVGASIGSLSDANGQFRIEGVRPGLREVTAQYLGYGTATQSVDVTTAAVARVTFELSASAVELEPIVATALGVERPQRSLTTSVQTLSGADLARAPEPNLVTALSGKISGVHIINANTPGGSARMVIRGVNSLTGNNQPLWVVDGVPVSNAASTGESIDGSVGYNAIDYGNVIQDMNPENIATISVLKGPNAAALYGSRAANGAVLITTKRGVRTGGMGVTARMDLTFESPLRLPEYQNLYGQGSQGIFQETTDESWGPRMDTGEMIEQPLYGGEPVPFVSHPDNVRDFFLTGQNRNMSVSLTSGGEDANIRLSLSRMDHEGMLPGFEQERTTVGVNARSVLTDRLRGNASLQYTSAGADNRPAQGYGEDNVMWQFLWFGRQVDTNLLEQRRYNEDGTQYNWNSRWNNNPYWTQLEDRNHDSRDRLIGSGSITYAFTPWLDLMVRAGTDLSDEFRQNIYAAGTKSVSSATGAYQETTIERQETNADFLLTARWPELPETMTL
ncbi:MAG: TonB-dependent receptor plug domain-containing protein, partial [Gemmatimonas sp.]|nr:TonB-dependent receptor plug domain-containing protein [Gemmatimonas sp.]